MIQPGPAQPDKWLTFGLAFVGGYGDAAGYVLAKTFTGHITGSLVLAAITIADHNWRGTFSHFSAILCFLAGILLSALIARVVGGPIRPPHLPVALGMETLLVIAAYFAIALHLVAGIEMFVVCFSLAMGLQNGAFRRTGGISVHTNYLTGMITGLLSTQAEQYSFAAAPAITSRDSKVTLVCGIWITFFLGAGTGAAMVFRLKEVGILGAALLLLAIIGRASVASR